MPKPIIHGFDHAKGGADPVPGLGGIQFHEGTYGADNSGDWLQVETTDATVGAVANTAVGSYSGLSVAIVDSSVTNGGLVFGTSGGGNIYIDTDAQIALTAVDGAVYIQDAVGATGSGPGALYVGFGNGMNFAGGYTTWVVDGFEVDSSLGIYLNNTSADAINISQTGGNTAGHDVNIHADHDVVVTAGHDLSMTATASAFLRAVGSGGVDIFADTGSVIIESRKTGTTATVNVRIESGCYFSVLDNDGSTEFLRVTGGGPGGVGNVQIPNLGTVNPGVTGQLWRSGGTVMIA